ncbi:MAG: hypothetical protein MSS84_06685 [Bacteroidales bacterium]|mgnify:FL=1|nr:hypothetical protein [Bacteroidales bacterium]MDD6782453.1 hypothetical protein [Bacteroidales bacterium]
MKKILALLLFCIAFTIQMYGQNEYVTTDYYAPDSSRHIVSYSSSFCKLRQYTMAIESIIVNNQQTWFLLIWSLNDVPQDAIILLKLFNNDVIELSLSKLYTEEYYAISSVGVFNHIATTAVGTSIGVITKENKYFARFSITPNQLDAIATYGVSKIRISTTMTYEEAKWKRDKLGAFFKIATEDINEYLKIYDKPIIYENF